MATPTAIVAYLVLFAGIGVLFLFANLVVGRFVRPRLPNTEKLEIYECGEPTIGSSFVQFDLRFYVVALLFIIFDVEVAFFFPWATVYGKATQLASPNMPVLAADVDPAGGSVGELSPQAAQRMRELGIANPTLPTLTAETAASLGRRAGEAQQNRAAVAALGKRIATTSLVDIAVFFAVLMVGFAYVWRRGDLDWVRATSNQHPTVAQRPPPGDLPVRAARPAESILSA
jgi:NADH-quinone oxidoreductase subunit A